MTRETLTTAGTTSSFRMGGSSNATFIYTIAGISGTVVVQAEGTQDGTNWVNLDENGATSLTANGVYGFENMEANYSYVRMKWVSGTATSMVISMQKNSG